MVTAAIEAAPATNRENFCTRELLQDATRPAKYPAGCGGFDLA
jgi:hypothetical protein